MIIQINLSKMKNKILPTCLQRYYRDSSGEFGNTSYHSSFDVLHLWLTGLIRYDLGWNHWRCLATSCIVVRVRHARNYMYSSFMVYNYCSYECYHSFYVSLGVFLSHEKVYSVLSTDFCNNMSFSWFKY